MRLVFSYSGEPNKIMNYMVTASRVANEYNPQPINVKYIGLAASLEELTSSPTHIFPDSEKEYDRLMAMNTRRLVLLGFFNF